MNVLELVFLTFLHGTITPQLPNFLVGTLMLEVFTLLLMSIIETLLFLTRMPTLVGFLEAKEYQLYYARIVGNMSCPNCPKTSNTSLMLQSTHICIKGIHFEHN